MKEKYIAVHTEKDIQNFIDMLYNESEKLFPKWHIKRALRIIPHEKTDIKNRYTLRFLLNYSYRGRKSDGLQCIHSETIYFACGIVIEVETYIHTMRLKGGVK